MKTEVKKTTCLMAAILIISATFSQIRIDWQQCYGTTDEDYCEGVLPLNNGYRVASSIFLADGMCECQAFYYGGSWMFDLDEGLSIQQQECSNYTVGHTSGLGFKLLGNNSGDSFIVSIDYSDINVSDPDFGLYVVKMDEMMEATWSVFLCTEHSLCQAIPSATSTIDGGTAVGVVINEAGGDATVHFGGDDCWVVRLDTDGHLLWERTLGTQGDETMRCMATARDGGLLVGLHSIPNGSGNIGCGQSSDILVKLDSNGNIENSLCFPDFVLADILNLDSGYLIAGTTSNRPDSNDCSLARCDAEGNVLWIKNYGGSGKESVVRVFEDGPDGYTVFANTTSLDGDVASAANLGVAGNEAGNIWVFHVDSQGNLLWERCIGSVKGLLEVVTDVVRTEEGDFILAANMTWFAEETSGDVHCTNNAVIPYSSQNIWVLHVTDVYDYTTVSTMTDYKMEIQPNPADNSVAVTGEDIRKVEVYDLLGQRVASMEGHDAESLTLSLEGLPQGVYLVTVTNKKGGSATRKLIIH